MKCSVFKCPPTGFISKVLTAILAFGAIYLVIYSFDPQDALPGNCTTTQNSTILECDGGNFFGLFFLYLIAMIGGIIISYARAPPLLGMLIMGFCLRNIPVINVAIYIDKIWSGYLRNMALTVILIRAGLGLDPTVLKKLSFSVVRLAFIPCLTEATIEAVTAHFLLNLPWSFSFMLGFILAAVSPAVVVPSILELEKKKLGVDQGINTLVIAASSIDDVLAISGFGICMGLSFSMGDSLILKIFRGPLEAIGGVVFGVLFGLLMWFFPSKDYEKFIFFRGFVLYILAFGSMFGSTAFKVPGAGALGVLTLAFVSGLGWRRDNEWIGQKNPITDSTDLIWDLFQPFLFGLIGAGLDISTINFKIVGFGIVVLIVGLTLRLIASFLAVLGTEGLNLKERLFIPVAWLPKATVQAAIGPVALDYAIKNGLDSTYIRYGELLLAIAAVSILLTAPIGAMLISILGPILLRESVETNVESNGGDEKIPLAEDHV